MNLQSLQQLLDAEMDRKEFLWYFGVSVLALTGVASIAKSLFRQREKRVERVVGYERSPYGR